VEHLHHFELAEDPFRSDAGEKFDVALPSRQEAVARLDRAVRQGKGLILLVGGVGAGKTRVARQLFDSLEEELFEAGMMVVLRREAGADWLVGRVARQLGIDDADSNQREAVIRQIYERLAIVHEDGRRAVLIIDDAHGLDSDAISELCGLVKLEYEERRILSVVLVGAPPLDAAIGCDPLFAHHVDVRVPLSPLPREEAGSYVSARIAAAGCPTELVLPGAVAALHEFSEGSPGRINALADNALYEAFLAGHAQITRSDVERAHRDLGWGTPVSAVLPDAGQRTPRRPTTVQAERTDPLMLEAGEIDAAPPAELDPELDAVFEPPTRSAHSAPGGRGSAEAHRTVVMDFDAGADPERTVAGRPRTLAERTRIQLDDRDGPPKGDDVDDLFMELLDD
jgi:type II secretory pathway predicted ATPase ExeA